MKKLIIIFILIFGVNLYAKVVELPPMGENYEIIEQDFDEFLTARIEAANFQAVIDENFDEAFRRYTTANEPLGRAVKDAVRTVTPSHTLENEMFTIDSAGVQQVLYPAGFTFNPLDYIALEEKYYIINGTREEEITWLKKQQIPAGAMIVVSEGAVLDISDNLSLPVYKLDKLMIERFYLKATPSVITQSGNTLTIREYCVEAE